MKRYAFIDVQNTASTAQTMLGFLVDWHKLANYLINKKSCTEVLFYTGIENGDTETANDFDSLSKLNLCTVKTKSVFAYKNKNKTLEFKCHECKASNIHSIDMGYRKKSNCDVELSVDVIEKSAPDVEFFIFTGDGDFEYLIRKALDKGVKKVYIVSYAGKDVKAGMTVSVFSTKLRSLIDDKKNIVNYMSLKDIKETIKRT